MGIERAKYLVWFFITLPWLNKSITYRLFKYTQEWFAINNKLVIKNIRESIWTKRLLTWLAQLFLPLAASFSKQLNTALAIQLLEYNTLNQYAMIRTYLLTYNGYLLSSPYTAALLNDNFLTPRICLQYLNFIIMF